MFKIVIFSIFTSLNSFVFSQLEKLNYDVEIYKDEVNECTYIGGRTEDNNYCVYKLDSEFNVDAELCNFFVIEKNNSFQVDFISPQKSIILKNKKEKGIDTVFFDCDLVKGKLIDTQNSLKTFYSCYTQGNNLFDIDFEGKNLAFEMDRPDLILPTGKNAFMEFKSKFNHEGNLIITKYIKDGLNVNMEGIYETSIGSVLDAKIIETSDSLIYFYTLEDNLSYKIYKYDLNKKKIIASKIIDPKCDEKITSLSVSFDKFRHEIYFSFVESQAIEWENKHNAKIITYNLNSSLEQTTDSLLVEIKFDKVSGTFGISNFTDVNKVLNDTYIENRANIHITEYGTNINVVHAIMQPQSNSPYSITNRIHALRFNVVGITNIAYSKNTISKKIVEKEYKSRMIKLDTLQISYANQIKSNLVINGESTIAVIDVSKNYKHEDSLVPAIYYNLETGQSTISEKIKLNKLDGLNVNEDNSTRSKTIKSRCIQSKSGENILWIIISETIEPNIIVGNTQVKYSVQVEKLN